MERSMFCFGVVVDHILRLKWRWAGRVAKKQDNRWIKRKQVDTESSKKKVEKDPLQDELSNEYGQIG